MPDNTRHRPKEVSDTPTQHSICWVGVEISAVKINVKFVRPDGEQLANQTCPAPEAM